MRLNKMVKENKQVKVVTNKAKFESILAKNSFGSLEEEKTNMLDVALTTIFYERKKREDGSDKQLLKLYRKITEGTAVAETFERAILEQGLTCEMIKIMSTYYKDDIGRW